MFLAKILLRIHVLYRIDDAQLQPMEVPKKSWSQLRKIEKV